MTERVKLKRKVGGIVHHTVPCTFCEHDYLTPCSDARKASKCANFVHLKDHPKPKEKASKPR